MALAKENLSAWQRWEMASLDDPANGATAAPAVALPTVEELQRIRDAAQSEGYATGFAEGLAAGLAEANEQLNAEASRLRGIAEAFARETSKADETIAESLLHLALDVAKAMLKTAIECRSELVLPAIREAIQYLPAVQSPARLVLHPEDAALVTRHLAADIGEGGWKVIEDNGVTRGGCRIESPTNQIDATTETRWHRIAAALGQNSEWLA
jgi:flagellar assembly protein FliH